MIIYAFTFWYNKINSNTNQKAYLLRNLRCVAYWFLLKPNFGDDLVKQVLNWESDRENKVPIFILN